MLFNGSVSLFAIDSHQTLSGLQLPGIDTYHTLELTVSSSPGCTNCASMNMFENAQKVHITGGDFKVITTSSPGEKDWKSEGLQILQHKIAPGAFHDSGERSNPPKCYPNTRKAALDSIMTWVKDKKKLTLFMWVYGSAGTGKSAILQSIADLCSTECTLAASFFFCRAADGRNNANLFIPTLVFRLMMSIPEIARRICTALAQNPLLLSLALDVQIKALIVDPLNEAALDKTDGPLLLSRPNLIIIDGLDECSGSTSLLETLLSASNGLLTPLYFLISSRPEPRIRDTFNDPRWNYISVRMGLDESYQPDDDFRHYLRSHFEQLRRKHPSLPKSWPSQSELKALVHNSSGQFIYISAVMKYLLDSRLSSMPQDRLDYILGLTPSHEGGAPFAEIDAMYHHILSTVSDIHRLSDILTFIFLVDFWPKTTTLIEAFFRYRKGEVNLIVEGVHSLIRVPPNGDPNEELRITHSSTLSDFLFDHSRSGEFFISSREARARLSGICLSHLKDDHSPLMQDQGDVHHLRSMLMINCVQSDSSPQLMVDLYDLDLERHLKFWHSTDNVIGLYEHDIKQIVTFISWLQTHDQRRPNYLFSHHLQTIDHWIRENLDSYSRIQHFDEFLSASTLTNFMSEGVFDILGIDKKIRIYAQKRRPDPLQIYACDRDFVDFYAILVDFLCSEERAREYFIHGRRFVKLALAILKYLNTDKIIDTEANREALGLFPKLLALCPYSTELSHNLFKHWLSGPPKPRQHLYSQRLVVYESIQSYLRAKK